MRPLSEQDRAILAKHGAGAAINDIAAEMGVKPQRVRRVVESIGPRHADGRALLAIDPEDIEGLRLTAALSQRAKQKQQEARSSGVDYSAYAALANATYHIDVSWSPHPRRSITRRLRCPAIFGTPTTFAARYRRRCTFQPSTEGGGTTAPTGR
jgi:hypothetical protein